MIHRYDQHRLIDIRGYDMRFFREIRRFSNNIIFPFLYPVNHRATGFVVLIPFILNFPFIRHSKTSPDSIRTAYQLPVDFTTIPLIVL